MDKIFDMIGKWDMLGQGVFFFFILLFTCMTITEVFKLFVILLRGWPPVAGGNEDDEE